MIPEELFTELKISLNSRIHFIEDKPEESLDSTIKACWLAASGFPRSAEQALKFPLPELTETQLENLHMLLDLRLKDIPLAHITGRQNFMGIELLADDRALIPRKETEILGTKALDISKSLAKEKKPVRVMDICCGAGNLGLAIACHNPHVEVFSTDISEDAVELTKDNISFLNLTHRVRAQKGDLFSAFDKDDYYSTTDIIVCNPPYISSAKVKKMNAEISDHEPELAFDGGMFGTKVIQGLIKQAPGFLIDEGWLLFEVGIGQGEFIMRLCAETNHFKSIEPVFDSNENIRVISAQKNK
jgi:release factor glutamine methyltransferase